MNGLVDPLGGIKEIISVTPWEDLHEPSWNVRRGADSVFTQPVTAWVGVVKLRFRSPPFWGVLSRGDEVKSSFSLPP